MPRIKQSQINHIKVTPVIAHGNEPEKEKIKGYEYIPLLFANIFLCAKKKSGKTNVLYNMVENLAGPDTEVYIFSSTLLKDPTYKALMKMLKKKNITYEGHTSFINPKTGENHLDNILHGSDSADDGDDDEDSNSGNEKGLNRSATQKGMLPSGSSKLASIHPPPGHKKSQKQKLTKYTKIDKDINKKVKGIIATKRKIPISHRNQLHPSVYESRTLGPQNRLKQGPKFAVSGELKAPTPYGESDSDDDDVKHGKRNESNSHKEKVRSKNELVAPDKIIIFDDLGADLRHPSISQLLKTNRHDRSKVILSTQYLTDLQPQAIKQLDFCMLFKAFGDDKLERIHDLFDLSTPWEQFYSLYKVATAAPFSFLYIDVRNEKFRKNFNIQLEVTDKTAFAAQKEEEKDGYEAKRQRIRL